MKLVFLGPPGSGKGTQAKIVSERFGVPHISTGDIFRENISNKTPLGRLASSYIDKGNLVPDDVTNAMVKKRLENSDCKEGFVLDGYPRTIPQAEFLEGIVRLDRVIDFKLNDNEIIKRISGRRTCKSCGAVYHVDFNRPKKDNLCDKCQSALVQREDERPEVIKHRLEVYKKLTGPLIGFYRKKKLLLQIDASGTIDAVSRLVIRGLESTSYKKS